MPKNSARPVSTDSQPVVEDECESDSEAEGEEDERGFRVSVDLSMYWGEVAGCVVWVARRRGRRVRWLLRRLRRAAALRRPFCLLAHHSALWPHDPLRVLHPADHLRVVPVEHEWQKPFSFCEEDDAAESYEPGIVNGYDCSLPLDNVQPEPETPSPVPSTPRHHTEPSFGPVSMDTSAAPRTAHSTSPKATATEQTPALTSSVSDEALQSVKRRALALLERVETSRADEAAGAPARKRRRRVRRRKRPDAALFTEPEPGERRAASPGPESLPPAPVVPQPSYQYPVAVSPPPPPAPAVRRNPSPARPPRLVRPLPPAAPAAPAAPLHHPTSPTDLQDLQDGELTPLS